MAISQTLLETSARFDTVPVAKSIVEARINKHKTAFLCHSHTDKSLVKGLVNLLNKTGWNVYVDWQDASLPIKPNKTTANAIIKRIEDSDYFLFLATEKSMKSRWCPWEIGIAHNAKSHNKIFLVQTSNLNNIYGNEYLQLYRSIDLTKDEMLAFWEPGATRNGRRLSEYAF